jgi:hypothetical protein
MIKNIMIDTMCRNMKPEECGITIDVPLRTARKLRRLNISQEEYKNALAQEEMKELTEYVIEEFTNKSPYGTFLNALWAR